MNLGIENLCNLTTDYLKSNLSEIVKMSLKKSTKFKESLDKKRTEEVREYYREINTGEKNPRYGKKNSLIPKTEEHRNKISNSLKNHIKSDNHRHNISEGLLKSDKFNKFVKSDENRENQRKRTQSRHDNSLIYVFMKDGEKIIHKGKLKNMEKYGISFYYLKKLRYGKIENHEGWKFVEMKQIAHIQ